MTVSNHESPKGVQTARLTREAGASRGGFRYGAVLPLAAIFTVGLTLSMAALVATEFTPQDKTETATYEINPVPEDIKDPTRTLKVDPLVKVEVPPPPPVLGLNKVAAVTLPIVEIKGKFTEFDMSDLDMGLDFDVVPIDKDPTPLLRIAPQIPTRFLEGDESGYCRVRFDINAEGVPLNVAVSLCTNKQLNAPSVRSVQNWKYAPKIQNGRNVSRVGLETTIRFDLNDEQGNLLPLPKGY